jgi:DNA helicase II / ATP-dependent DNA helicase PcrA
MTRSKIRPMCPEAIKFISTKYTPEQELEAVAKSVKGFVDSFADFPVKNSRRLRFLFRVTNAAWKWSMRCVRKGIEPIELISSTSETRAAAGALSYLLAYLADPQSARKLAKAYEVWSRDWRGTANVGAERSSAQDAATLRPYIQQIPAILRKMVDVENFIAPRKANDWLAGWRVRSGASHRRVGAFRVNVQRWLNAVTLPIDQLVLTLAQDVFSDVSDLALAYKLALVLRRAADDHADWRLPELTAELAVIAKNERRFIGFSSDDSGFDPERHRGRVVVTTMHKAKGLEWDRVYLMSVNNYDFPSNMPNDRFISEKWFVRGGLDLEAESLAQLTALESHSEYDWYEEGAATNARGWITSRNACACCTWASRAPSAN